MDASVPIFEHLLGPLGWDVPPAGEHSFEEIVADYRARLGEGGGAVHVNCMFTMAESRAAMLAAGEAGCGPVWVSWGCDEDGESPNRVHMLAALFVAEGMGAAAVIGQQVRRDAGEVAEIDLLAPGERRNGSEGLAHLVARHFPAASCLADGRIGMFGQIAHQLGIGNDAAHQLLNDILGSHMFSYRSVCP